MKVLSSDGTCSASFPPRSAAHDSDHSWDLLGSSRSEILSFPNQLWQERQEQLFLFNWNEIRITDNSKILRSVGEETIRKVLCNPGSVALQGCHGDHLLRGSFAVSWQTLPTEETICFKKKKKRTPSPGRKEQSTKNSPHVKWRPAFSLYKCPSCSHDWHPKWKCQNCQYTETIHYLCAILLQLEVVNYLHLAGHSLSSLWA